MAGSKKRTKELTQQNYDAIRNHLFDRIHTTGEVIKNDFPNILRTAIETEAWKHFMDAEGKPFRDLVSWLQYTFPNGASMGQGKNAISYSEALALTEGHPEVHKVLAEHAPKRPVGGDKRSKNAVFDHGGVRHHDFLRHSNRSRAVLTARLAQEYPKHFKALQDGEYKSLRAACEGAGMLKPANNPLSRLKSNWNKAAAADRKAFLKWLKEQEG